MTMDEATLSEIEARAKAATPGPWVSFDVDRDGTTVETSAGEILMGSLGSPDATSADTEFVAHAREDVPALVAEVRRLREVNARLVRLLKDGGLIG